MINWYDTMNDNDILLFSPFHHGNRSITSMILLRTAILDAILHSFIQMLHPYIPY